MLEWQVWQADCCGCGSGGGKPWQFAQLGVTGDGVPHCSLPWQPVLEQVRVARL